MRFGEFALAVGCIDTGNRWRIDTTSWSIVAGIRPSLAVLGPPMSWIDNRGCRLVSEKPFGSSQSVEDMVRQWAKIPGGSPDPVCKGGAIQLDALAGINLRLPGNWWDEEGAEILRDVFASGAIAARVARRYGLSWRASVGIPPSTIRLGAEAWTTELSQER